MQIIKDKTSPEKDNLSSNTYYNLINNLLLRVQKPGQYLGIEWGHLVRPETRDKKQETRDTSALKHWDDAKVRTALIYPDLYELGMSNFGTKILYQIINRHPDFLCDRAYAPMKDMEELLRKESSSLWGWESFQALNKFDLLGFSLSYELNYSNVLNILELANVGILSCERKDLFPLIFAGGPAAFNPEPMAEFVDFFIIGDGEEVILEILSTIRDVKEKCQIKKEEVLLKLSQIQGVYVPSFYKPDPDENYLPKPIQEGLPKKIIKRVVSLNDENQPTSGPVPYLASVQDRQILEIRRGCDRGCRFCQPGYVYLPVRERTPDNLVELSKSALKNTGYDEYSLLSLSASDYTQLHELALKLNGCHAKDGVSLSMPSQRADRFDLQIANELNTVRKSGITLAPEAGTERLRAVINKGLKETEIKKAIENVYDSGFSRVKLYFMIGLPTETKEDLDGIIKLLEWAYNLSKLKNKRPLEITCTISTFVPKPFTPFQWFSQNTSVEFEEKIKYLKQKTRDHRLKTVKLNCTDPETALLEAAMSRGDRRFSKLIYLAHKYGAKFDSWGESLNLDTWNKAAKETDIDLMSEATKHREVGSINPWDIIDTGLLNKFLIKEYEEAIKVSETPACTENKCHACGVCFELDVVNEVTTDKSNNNKFVKTLGEGRGEKVKKESSTIHRLPSPKFPIPIKSIQKVEIIHTKTQDLRFISHLDVQRLFERALRRADVPVSFSEGFNPRPKMHWLLPLPIYYESNYELLHLDLNDYVKDSDLQIMLNGQLPQEFQVKSCINVDLSSKFPNIDNIKISYNVLTIHPDMWEEFTGEVDFVINCFLEQKSLILKVLKGNKEKESKEQKEIDIRKNTERIIILNTKPLELELVLSGNTRAEIILNYITQEVLMKKINERMSCNLQSWQQIWKIRKELVTKSTNV